MEYFHLSEFTNSDTAKRLGIKNIPNKLEELNIIALVENILDPLREAYGKPIIVTSGFRCPKLNKAVGGASTSQHQNGQASDIRSTSRVENKKIFELAKLLPFDLLIWEKGDSSGPDWVHISYSPRNRRLIIK